MIGLASNSLATTLLFTGLFMSLRNALGEELGWRGFAAPVMTRVFGFWRGQTLLGIFWFLFHVPALLGTSYGSSPHPLLGNVMFFVSCMALSYFLGWVRLQSASVWPSALFHASHNFYFLHLFEPVEVRDATASYLIGEQGLLCAAVQVALAAGTFWAWRRQTVAASQAPRLAIHG
jgi:membrane protease YdiL (CAAX protease family)